MRAVLFDLDGTLLNSTESNYRAFKVVGEKMNATSKLTLERYLEWYSPNYFELYEKMGIPEKDWPKASQIWREYYISHEKPDLFPHVIDVLSYLRSKKYKLGLVTSGSVNRVNSDLERKKIRDFFEVVVYGEGFKKEELKPSPKQLLVALEKMEETADGACYVGDTPPDIEAGRRAGMMTIAVTTGFGLAKKIEESEPDMIIDSLEELERIF